MTARRSPKHRTRPGSGRTTPKGTRPPGTAPGHAGPDGRVEVDHHLDLAPPKHLHGRAAPPNSIRQRSGHRGGR